MTSRVGIADNIPGMCDAQRHTAVDVHQLGVLPATDCSAQSQIRLASCLKECENAVDDTCGVLAGKANFFLVVTKRRTDVSSSILFST